MKRITILLSFVLITFISFGQSSPALDATWFGPNYIHLNSSANTMYNYTVLDSNQIGNNPYDIVIFSHNWGPDINHEQYMRKSCGLWYTGTNWSIYDETLADMDTLFAFNVLNANTNGTGFIHTVTVDNVIDNWSEIDHPLLNGHPERIFFITKTWNNGVYDTAHVGIWYDQSDSKWTVYNEAGSGSILQPNSTYNIFIPDPLKTCFKQVAINSYYVTEIDNPLLNGNPNARIYAVHDYTNESASMGYVNDEIGVWYDGAYWTVYTENGTDLFVGATFNILVASDVITGLDPVKAEAGAIKVCPNPAKDRLHVLLKKEFRNQDILLSIASIEGRTVLQKHIPSGGTGEILLDVEGVPSGLYLLTATTSNGVISTKVNIVR